MKNNCKNIVWGCLLLLVLCITSCRKFVEVSPPITQLVTSSVFNNSSSATAAITAIYSKMSANNESFSMSQRIGLMADELTNFSTNATVLSYYRNSMTTKTVTYGPWANAYNYIYQANSILAGLEDNTNVSPIIKQQLIGESKFVRAFWNFYLTNLYGDVPLVTSIDYTQNATIVRSGTSEVYKQIIADLNDAQNLLNSNYVDGTDTVITSEKIRPTKWTAMALLERAYLYVGKYDSAEYAASTVIGNTNLFKLCSTADLSKVFLANSSETIWQLQTPQPFTNGATADGKGFILISAPSTGTLTCTTISTQLLNSFESGDLRKDAWISTYTTPATTYYFPYKYQVRSSSSATEYVMVLRLAEQYLIRAEARAFLNNLTGSADDLNIIRNRANLGNTSAVTQADLMTAILHERRVELFSEWGHRWFDIVRTGNANAIMGEQGNVCQMKGGVWNANWQLMPIPQSERDIDANLTQNVGY